MTDERVVTDALEALAGPRHPRDVAAQLVARAPGLYAFYGGQGAWDALLLTPAFEDQPLYVGKAESSLNGRDVRTHFSTGKTGSSTVRRSLAALLVDDLALVAVPRNLAKPDGSANFALDAGSEERLTAWMDRRLRLATWISPPTTVLDEVETAVLKRLRPPLNLAKVAESRDRLRLARGRMAASARTWTAGGST